MFPRKNFIPRLFYFITQNNPIILVQTTTSTEKEGAVTFDSFIPSQSLYFPPPQTIDEISPGDKRGLEQTSGKGQVNGVCTASRQKDEEYISIRSLLSNSPRPLALLLFPLHPLSLSLSRGFLEEEIASKSTLLAHVPRITVFFSLVKGPLDGMDQVKWGVSRMRIFFSSFDRSDLVRLLNLFVHAV